MDISRCFLSRGYAQDFERGANHNKERPGQTCPEVRALLARYRPGRAPGLPEE
jgi:hypothetical protein